VTWMILYDGLFFCVGVDFFYGKKRDIRKKIYREYGMPDSFQFRPESAKAFLQEVTLRSGQNLESCYQCRRCAAGCPVMENTGNISPDTLIRLIILGDRSAALNNELVRQCVSCYTCGVRCPNNIQTARITETLKQMSAEEHMEPLRPDIGFFHKSFFNSGLRWGRVNELEFMGFYEMKNLLYLAAEKDFKSVIKEMAAQLRFAWKVIRRKRMHFGFLKAGGRKELKALQKNHRH